MTRRYGLLDARPSPPVGRGRGAANADRARLRFAVLVAAAMVAAGCGPSQPRAAPPRPNASVPGQTTAPGQSTAPPPASNEAGAFTASVGVLPPPASAWPSAGHDARHSSGVTATVIGPRTAHQRWTRKLEGNVTPGPVLGADGTIYAASNAGVLHALDPATGADRWTFDGGGSYGSDLSVSPAVLGDGTILWPAPHNRLVALDATGHQLWHETFGGFVLSPAVAGAGRVYVADQNGGVAAIEVGNATHNVVWQTDIGGTSYTSPTVGPDGTIVVGADNDLVGLADDGPASRVRWRWHGPAQIEVSAAVAPDGTAIVGPNNEFTYGIGPDGAQRWKYRKGDWSYSSVVATPDGKAWFGDHLGFLDTVDAATGNEVRRHATIPKSEPHPGGVGVWTMPAIDGTGAAYFGTVVGHVYGVGPDGARLFDLDVGSTVDSYPALGADGTLYIGSSDGVLHAIGA